MTPSEALLRAAKAGDCPAARQAIATGVDVKAEDAGDGNTPINLAAAGGHIDIVKLLLDAGVPARCENTYGFTALHNACEAGHRDIVQLLIERGADPGRMDNDSWRPIHLAAQNGHHEIVKRLLACGIDPNAKLVSGHTALHLASLGGHTKVIATLLDYGAVIDQRGHQLETALMLAATRGQEAAVRLLLKRGADVNARSGADETALHFAATYGHYEIGRILIKAGADLTVIGGISHLDPIETAAKSGCLDIIKAAETKRRRAPTLKLLTLAARSGRVGVVKHLIEQGAPVNLPAAKQAAGAGYKDTPSPLHEACYGGHPEVVDLLLAAGADPRARNEGDPESPTCLELMLKNSKSPRLHRHAKIALRLYEILGLDPTVPYAGKTLEEHMTSGSETSPEAVMIVRAHVAARRQREIASAFDDLTNPQPDTTYSPAPKNKGLTL